MVIKMMIADHHHRATINRPPLIQNSAHFTTVVKVYFMDVGNNTLVLYQTY